MTSTGAITTSPILSGSTVPLGKHGSMGYPEIIWVRKYLKAHEWGSFKKMAPSNLQLMGRKKALLTLAQNLKRVCNFI